jgi:methyl-accepting chemotaxis protein
MTSWIAHLPLRWKFAVLGLAAFLMTAVPSATVLSEALGTLRVLNQEAAGLIPAKATLDLIRLTQEHRGLSAGVLSGDTGKQGQRQERQALVDQTWVKVHEALKAQLDADALVQEARAIEQGWKGLAAEVSDGKISVQDSGQRHTALIARALLLVEDIADASGLTLDADPQSYNLVNAAFRDMPRLTEKLGQARARGNATIVKKETTPENTLTLLAMLEAAQIHSADALRDIQKSGALKEADAQALQEAFEQAKAGFAKGRTEVERVARGGDALATMDAGAYFQAMTEVIKAQFGISDHIVRRLDDLLARRVVAERVSLMLTFSLIASMMVVCTFVALVITRVTSRAVVQAVKAAQALAEGDLTQQIHSTQRDEIGDLLRATGAAIEQLKHIITRIRTASESVATASGQIAQGNLDLSSRTEQTASSLEQTASSMEEMSATVSQNANTAQNANRLALEASNEAARSGQVFSQVVTKMGAIKQASAKIAEINSVIDGIAFQTNILALNAAVEAARAGEQGRGFAVVAGEVRTLAQRSAQAAREIKGLIANSTESVEEGYGLATETGQSIERLVTQVQKVSQFMAEIATGSEQQHLGITQVNQAVSLLDRATQQNAALVEEASAAASSLKQQAHRLQEAVGQFRLA